MDKNRSKRLAARALIVKSARDKLGMSRMQLASAAELHLGTIRNVEAGLREPTTDSLRKIAKALGIPVARLLEGA